MSYKRKTIPGILLLWLVLAVLLLGGIGFGVGWRYLQPAPPQPSPQRAAPPSYQPVVGDVHDPEDDDPDIIVAQPLTPGFQFARGGFQLGGHVQDARAGQAIVNAVVWIALPAQIGQPTSVALHTVTDGNGAFAFAHLAPGSYTLAASRYNNRGDGRYYAERVFTGIALKGNTSNLTLSLTALPTPGQRSVARGQAKNLILIDLRGFYADSLLNDSLLLDQTQNIRAFLQRSTTFTSLWHPYGWRPLDQYALLTGSYPQWATYDNWPRPVPWGEPDHLDTRFWFTGGRAAHLFGQESLFDVAKGYGMQTGVIAGSDYILSDATTRNVDRLQLSSSFSDAGWLAQMEDAVLAGTQEANGLLLYGELAPLAVADQNASPDAQGGAYQQALQRADRDFGALLGWLQAQGLLQNTAVALTTSQAQANHTDSDNYYGMGVTGQGSSKHALLAVLGPGCPTGHIDTPRASFAVASTVLGVLGLPGPAEARLPRIAVCRG